MRSLTWVQTAILLFFLGTCTSVVGQEASLVLPVPFQKQELPEVGMHNSICGYTSLAMAAGYACEFVPTMQTNVDILKDRGLDPDGHEVSLALKIKEAGKSLYGLSLRSDTWTVEQIMEEVSKRRPVIAGIVAGEIPYELRQYPYSGSHYLVVVGYDQSSIICNDPGTQYGKQKHYPNDIFSRAFTKDGSNVIVGFSKTHDTGNRSYAEQGPAGSLRVAPENWVLCVGDSVRLTAIMADRSGTRRVSVDWSSSADSVASADSSGLVTGLSAGEADVQARCGGIVGSSHISVNTSGASSAIVMPRSGCIEITLVEHEASSENSLEVLSPERKTLSRNTTKEKTGKRWQLGSYKAGQVIVLRIYSSWAKAYRYPKVVVERGGWLTKFEDWNDHDYNDLILRLRLTRE